MHSSIASPTNASRATQIANVQAFLRYVYYESPYSFVFLLEKRLGLITGDFSYFEQGYGLPCQEDLERMARATGFNVDDILTFKDSGLAANIKRAAPYWPCCRPGIDGHLISQSAGLMA